MKFIVPQGQLLWALNLTGKCVGSNNIIPILSHYKFDIDGEKLTITGSTMEVFLSTTISIDSNKLKKSIAIPGMRLSGLVKALPDQPLTFEIEEREVEDKPPVITVKILAGKGVYRLPAEDGEDFPVMNNKRDLSFKINSQLLLKGIQRTLFAVHTDKLREFSGLYVRFADGQATFTGTNAHILSTYTTPVDINGKKVLVIPVQVLQILQTVPMDEEIEIAVDEKNIVLKLSDDTVLKSILMDSKFPDYESVIPAHNEIEAVVNRNEFIASLKRVTHFANGVTHGVRFKIDNQVFALGSRNEDLAEEALDEVSHSFNGDDIEIGMNGLNLLACVNRLDSENVYFSFSTPNRAILIREEHTEPKINTNLMLIMPIVLDYAG